MADDGTQWHVSPLGGFSRKGRWRVAPSTIIVTLLGGADLDLTDAEFAGVEARLTKVSVIGGTKITVPPNVRVAVSGFSLIGSQNVDVGHDTESDAPVLHVKAFSILGGIEVRGS